MWFILFSVSLIVYWFYHRLTFWKRQGLINEASSIYNRVAKPYHIADQESYKKFGPIVGVYEGLRPCLMLGDPMLVSKVMSEEFHNFPNHRKFYEETQLAGKSLVTLEDEKWKAMRNIVTPIFASGNLRKMKPLMDQCVELLERHLREAAVKGKIVDFKRYFSAFALNVVFRTVFGKEIDALDNPDHILVQNLQSFFGKHISLKSLLVLWFPSLMKTFNMYLFDYNVLKFLDDFYGKLIEAKKQEQSSDPNAIKDFVRLLMDTNALTTREIIDQCMLFIVAGFDTTSTTLTNIVYCLAVYPECQEKLYKEICEAVGQRPDSEIDLNIIMEIKYLDAVIYESIRFLPAVPRIERRANKDCMLGNIFIPKDTIITIPCYAINHDEKYFKDPEKFMPDRFLNGEHTSCNLFLPFATGPRNCIGQRLAMMEMKTCLVRIIRKFRFDVTKETKIPPDFFRGQPVLSPINTMLKVIER